MGVVDPSDTPANGSLAIAALDSARNLKVNVVAGGGGGGAVTIANAADVTQGAIADAAVVGDNSGTISAKLRGINKILNSVWSSANSWLQVSIQNATLAVTQSGSPWTVAGTNTNNSAAPPVTLDGVIPAIANAAVPSWTEGNAVLLDVDLKGSIRTRQTGSGFTASQVSVGNTATLLAAANNARTRITITNTAAVAVYIGASGVTTSTGDLLAGVIGYPKLYRTTAALYGIVTSGSNTVTVMEETT